MGTGCEESYGFLPCSTSLGGTLFLIVVYGYCLLIGANQLSDGSELLLQVLDPGIIGGLVLPMLGALPDSLIIIISGLAGSRAEAQEQVAVGVGTLAGSTIMLLTIAWGGPLLAGRCDLNDQGKAADKQLTKGWNLFKTGITTDKFTPNNAIIMIATVLLYATVQIPAFMGSNRNPAAAGIGGVICLISLLAYCTYQVLNPELQRRKIEAAAKKQWRMGLLREFARHTTPYGSLLTASGDLDRQVVTELFNAFDDDHNNSIDEVELRALLMGITLKGDGASSPEAVDRDLRLLLAEFDRDKDGCISLEEFSQCLHRWIGEKMEMLRRRSNRRTSLLAANLDDLLREVPPGTDEEEQLLPAGEDDDEDGPASSGEGEAEEPATPRAIVIRAVAMLLLGTSICAFFSDPVIDAVTNFSKASQIPAFFVAFCVTPFASNASELVSSLKFAAGRRKKNISLALSQVYGAVTMNNTMCLGLFLLVVHYRELEWDFTSEVLVTVGATVLVGAIGASKTTFKSIWALPNLCLFPLSILVVWVLDNVLHLDG